MVVGGGGGGLKICFEFLYLEKSTQPMNILYYIHHASSPIPSGMLPIRVYFVKIMWGLRFSMQKENHQNFNLNKTPPQRIFITWL